MSDQWGIYFEETEGALAFITFDDGIALTINDSPLKISFKLKIEMGETNENGMPTSREAERLAPFDESIEAKLLQFGGLYLGRITTDHNRWILALVPDDYDQLGDELAQLAKNAAYPMAIFVTPDPDKKVYWDDLYPSADNRQVMNDITVLNALYESGDTPSEPRPVEHWSYFEIETSALDFADWLQDAGYTAITVEMSEASPAAPQWLVRSQHQGTMLLDDISAHTLNHKHKSEEFGGTYDGWETEVVK